MTKNTGLGKGLDALLLNNIVEEEKVLEGETIQNLKIIEVEPNREQPRRNFDEESIEELSNSIKEYGVIQPIIVTKQENYYQIVAGERRWRASKKAGLTEIPAIVRDYDKQRNSEIALIENIQREDLNPIEKATAIRELLDTYSLTQQQLADKLGISRSGLANTVRILNLDKRVIDLVKEGNLTEGHCKALLAIEDPEKQYEAAREAQGLLEVKIARLKDLVANAKIIDESQLGTDSVHMMNKVKVKNLNNKMVMEFTIVGETEADFTHGKLASTTPIAKALMGHTKGETVEAHVPSGLIKFQILDISI